MISPLFSIVSSVLFRVKLHFSSFLSNRSGSRQDTVGCIHFRKTLIVAGPAYGQQFIAYLQTVPDQCLYMPEIYDAGTMDPDEVAFGQLAPDRCEVERNYEAATSCQVDAGITSGSLYPLDFIHCRLR